MMQQTDKKPVTLTTLFRQKRAGEKIAVLTAYDASFAAVLDAAGVDVILVGDSLGMVIQGHQTTLPVTLDEVVYHTACVARGRRHALLVADLPFMSYTSPEQAMASAARLMKEGGAHMVKLEGGADQLDVVAALSGCGIPVCAHLGLQPQSVHKLGGYHVQGREPLAAEKMQDDALALQQAGADMLVLECVPSELGSAISHALDMPVIGIGAGPGTDGQVLVLHDLLGITPGAIPRFAACFLQQGRDIPQAVEAYVQAVRSSEFPASEHCFD